MKKLGKNKKIKILLFLIVLGLGLFSSSTSLARVTCPPNNGNVCNFVNWPRSPLGTGINPTCENGKCIYAELPTLIRYFYDWGIALGGLATFIALLIAGFLYITSIGNPQQMADAKDRIIWSFFGLIFLLSSWLILNTINPQLTTFRPLVLSLEAAKISPHQPCKKDADCPENHQCRIPPDQPPDQIQGRCFPRDIAIAPCRIAEVTFGDITKTVSRGKCVGVNWDTTAGKQITVVGVEPPDCLGALRFYTRERCHEHEEVPTFLVTNEQKKFSPGIVIQSMQLVAF